MADSIGCLFSGWVPFWKEVQQFKKEDSLRFPASNQALFIGSSSFTMWKDVQDFFPKYKILNRAFGGSQLLDLIRYRYEVIFPYQPKQIVMYCGENDFAASDTVTVIIAVNRFKTLFGLLREKYPNVPFAYVSMKPSPSRKHLMKKYEAANDSIATWLSGFKKTKFVDVFHAMLDEKGEPMEDIFLQDRLHMNGKGYAILEKTH
ncbi:MAG: G-D-S-L family lipolytic protein [Chitinophagaceae bacterium]|nr:G-D-S-L family lipolytic protein [Chitinophagaceae bacterium]